MASQPSLVTLGFKAGSLVRRVGDVRIGTRVRVGVRVSIGARVRVMIDVSV